MKTVLAEIKSISQDKVIVVFTKGSTFGLCSYLVNLKGYKERYNRGIYIIHPFVWKDDAGEFCHFAFAITDIFTSDYKNQETCQSVEQHIKNLLNKGIQELNLIEETLQPEQLDYVQQILKERLINIGFEKLIEDCPWLRSIYQDYKIRKNVN